MRALLCIVLVVSTALAGCANKDKDDEPAPDPLATEAGSEPATIGDYARYYRDGETDSCEGCIRLDPTGGPDPHQHVQPVYETQPGVTVPLPAIGDHLEVRGQRRDPTGPELGGIPLPTDRDGQYHFDLVFEALTTTLPVLVHPESPLARLQATYAYGTYPVDGTAFEPYTSSLLVDLETRAVTAISTHGSGAFHPDAMIGTYSNQDKSGATHQTTPPAANLFWLGAHLWGQTWYKDDTFTASWTPPGASGPALWYDYRVTKAETVQEAEPAPPRDDEMRGHIHDAPRGPLISLVVRVDVHDHFGRQRQWELSFEKDAPYPASLRLSRDMHASVDRSLVPPEIVWQTIDVVRRGPSPAGWSETTHAAPAGAHGWDEASYRIDERPASPALDTLPVYPLTAAIEDLGNLDPSFREWWRGAPRAVLADARLEPVLFYSGLALALEYQWTFTFLDTGTTRAWSVARLASGPDVVAPVAHRAEAVSSADVSSSLRQMDPARHADPLSAGDGLAAALVAAGVTARVDRAHYAMTHSPQEGLGGTLMVGAARLPDAPEALSGTGTPGYLVQDLITGAVVDALVFES